MFSYRHAFHAGSHADVLKHMVLVAVLRHLAEKDKAFRFIDTHAGAGRYSLEDAVARKHAEFETGIGRLWSARELPEPLGDYVAQVRAFQQGERAAAAAGKQASAGGGVAADPARAQGGSTAAAGQKLRRYPGSPQLALPLLRERDEMHCFERHTTEARNLARNLATAGRHVHASAADGFTALKSVLPPPTRRGFVLIDPSYEDKRDYLRVRQALADSLARFATGVYAIWYPLVQRREALLLPAALARLAPTDWLDVTLTVRRPSADSLGLHGSGVFLVHPPWPLVARLRIVLPFLARALAQDAGAGFTIRTSSDAPVRTPPLRRPVRSAIAPSSPGRPSLRRAPPRRPRP